MLTIINSLLRKELDSVAYEDNDLILEVLDQVIQGDLSVRIHFH